MRCRILAATELLAELIRLLAELLAEVLPELTWFQILMLPRLLLLGHAKLPNGGPRISREGYNTWCKKIFQQR